MPISCDMEASGQHRGVRAVYGCTGPPPDAETEGTDASRVTTGCRPAPGYVRSARSGSESYHGRTHSSGTWAGHLHVSPAPRDPNKSPQ